MIQHYCIRLYSQNIQNSNGQSQKLSRVGCTTKGKGKANPRKECGDPQNSFFRKNSLEMNKMFQVSVQGYGTVPTRPTLHSPPHPPSTCACGEKEPQEKDRTSVCISYLTPSFPGKGGEVEGGEVESGEVEGGEVGGGVSI